jgi:hypothetical protein
MAVSDDTLPAIRANTACSGQVGMRRVFQAFFAALGFSRFDGESRPTHLPLTLTIGQI